MGYRPTFVVSVTPVQVETGTTENGQPYTSMKDAVVSHKGKPDQTRTIVAFGPAAAIASRLVKGAPVALAVQNNGATMRLIGLPRSA